MKLQGLELPGHVNPGSTILVVKGMLMRNIIRAAVATLLAVSFASSASAQSDQTGFPAFSSQAGAVNLGNLNTHMIVPVVRKNGRGIGLNLSVGFDSTIYSVIPASGQTPAAFNISPNFGWNIGAFGIPFAVTGQVSSTTQLCPTNANATNLTNWTYVDPLGTGHSLPASQLVSTDANCGPAQASGFAADQSGYFMTVKNDGTAVVQGPSGDTINIGTLSTSITDRNGNLLSADGSTGVTDTLGVTALTNSVTFDSNINITSITYTFPAPNGASDSVVLNYKSYPKVASGFGCPNTTEATAFGGFHFAQTLMDSIVLPDGSKYSFQYEPTPASSPAWVAGAITGRVQSVTLPTGATISYTYPGPNGGINCADGTTMGLTRTTSDGTTIYSRSVSSTTQTTTVTDPQGNQTVASFVSLTNPQVPPPTNSNLKNWIETQRQTYQGSQASGTLLQTTLQCYNGNKSSCNSTPVALPITETSAFFLLPNGKKSQRETFHDSNTGLPTEVDEYDFGASQPGPLLRKTVTSYASLGNNIISLPQSITVCSPGGSDAACNGPGTTGGTRVTQMTFGYDESAVTATSGITQHVAISGSRGNRTSVRQWLNTNNSTLTTTNTFDDTGDMLIITDPGGHQISFTYGGCNGAFITQTTMPSTTSPNLTHHQTSATYDCNTGLLSASTDQNGNATKFFYDNRFRSREVDYPDGGKTLTSYPDPNRVTIQQKIDGSRSTFSTTLGDGYGRTLRTATANGESTPYNQQDYCFDSNGHLAFRSYPYQGNAPNTAPACPNTSQAGDSFAYDALGRPTKVTHSDGTFSVTSYVGQATQTTDEGNGSTNVSHILQNDGLGHLASVCEVYGGVPLLGDGGAPVSCGLDIASTGFLTTYSYDILGNKLTVAQGALTNRTYTYDSLSRMTSETTPEAGTVSYAYNSDSLLATRVRPAPNQSDPAVTTTTNYQYDALHRLTGRTYSGDPANTPAPTFNYDESNVWGTSLTNTIGQLTSEMVGSPLIAEQIFSYDPVGRPLLNAQCTPQTCSATPFAPYSLSYQYDLLGNVTSAGNGVSVAFSNSYNIAGRFTGMTSSWNDANHPATLLSGAHYSPTVVTDTLGNGLMETTNFSARGQLTSYLVQAPAAPAGGSVTVSGSERSTQVQQSGAPGQDSVTINGSLQSKQVQTQAATPASVTVTIGGADSTNILTTCVPRHGCHSSNIKDAGTIQFTVTAGGTSVGPVQVSYNGNSTTASLAAALFSAFPSNSVVSMSNPNGSSRFMLTTIATGSSANSATFSARLASSCVPSDTMSCAGVGWTVTPGQANFSGGQNAVSTTVYDSGTCTITVNSHGDNKSWSGSGTTAASIAAGLQSSIAGDGSASVNANVSNNTVTVTAKTSGAATNYPLASSCSYDSGNFNGPSFTSSNSGSVLTGGKDAGFQTVYDTGTVTVTVNGFSKTVAYGQTDTPTTLMAAMASALSHNTDPNSPVNTSASGGTLSFTAVTGGVGTDYTFTSSSATNNANFTGTSFPASPASGTMAGGANTNTVYSYNLTPAPDGQVTAANDLVNGNWAFGYDPFNRLASSNKNSSQQTFNYQYDRYGNRWQQNAPQGGPAAQYLFDNNNHFNGSGVTYDARGEVLTDGLGNSFIWDAEGRLIQVKQGSTVTSTYAYDAEGRRVRGPIGEYVYDLDGRMITHIGLNGIWAIGEIYAGSRHLATYSQSTTNFYHGDWLGTKRVMTAVNGTASNTCTGFAFGDGVNCTGTIFTFNGFTDDIHDSETNLEHTLFRKYSSTQGRWLTPDPAGAPELARKPGPAGTIATDPKNPQSWNLYAYVLNSPTTAKDPLGLECVWDDGSFDSVNDIQTGSVGLCQEAGGTWIELGLNGRWSDSSNDILAETVADIQNDTYGARGMMVTVIGLNGTPYITVFDSAGRVDTTIKEGTISNYAYYQDERGTFGNPRTAVDPDGAWARGLRLWSEAHPGLPLDPYERDILLGSMQIDYMTTHLFGRDLKESVCNAAGLELFTLGAMASPFLEGAAAWGAWGTGFFGGSVITLGKACD